MANNTRSSRGSNDRAYASNMRRRIEEEYVRRRREEDGATRPGDQDSSGMLFVSSVDFCVRANAPDHHTEQFELVQADPAKAVLRRGQPFLMTVKFNRCYQPEEDVIILIFNFGSQPSPTKRTREILTVKNQQELSEDNKQWDVCIQQHNDAVVTFQVQIAATAMVGHWRCSVRTFRTENKKEKDLFRCDEDIYVLFNPWCKDDGVFLEEEHLRQEYVLNDSGKVWMGSHRKPFGRRWIFGQFDDSVLPVVTYLLERSKMQHHDRGNPVLVARAISAVVNANDDDKGVLIGRWDGKYNDGTSPSAWTGSIAILEEYLNNNWRSVRYGQCWVFSAITVTVCRALGIPCRSVTNFVSAHDGNSSLTIDKYFRKNGEEIREMTSDSCWNFHVWNDVWMARPDLPSGYGGWQIIDATPQEQSDNKFRCGPASLEAVRRGEVCFNYDSPFVFAEVNADLCHFQEDPKSDWGYTRTYINQYEVGRRIVTKSPCKDDDEGDSDMEDVTSQYKDTEGSEAERLSVMNAVRGCELAKKQYQIPKKEEEDVSFDLVEIDTIPLGQNFSVVVNVQNKATEQRTIAIVLSASSVFYTGVTAHKLKNAEGEFVLQPNGHESLQIIVNSSEYLDKLVDHSLVKIYSIANVKETKQTWSEEDDFPFENPKLSIEIQGDFHVEKYCSATFSFHNPLPKTLTDCKFRIEGPGLQRPKTVKYGNVKPGDLVSFTESFKPRKVGRRKLMGTFSSKQLSNIHGCKGISIQE